jgi:hypothetical protein
METKDSFVGLADGQKFFRENRSEAYVEIPPAYIITDERGDTWTLGFRYNANYEFDVCRNDVSTGEFASKIVMQRGQVRIFTRTGWKAWGGKTFI